MLSTMNDRIFVYNDISSIRCIDTAHLSTHLVCSLSNIAADVQTLKENGASAVCRVTDVTISHPKC